jgi:uncharacterized protein
MEKDKEKDIKDKRKQEEMEHEKLLKELSQFDKKYTDSMKPPSGEAIAIRVSEDEMKVFVTVAPPADTGKDVSREMIVDELKRIGVVNGIDEEAVNDIFMYGSYNVDVPVAKGTPPSDGISAKIEYKFDVTGDKKVEFKTDEFGNIDFKEMNKIDSVEEGQLLAVKIPSVPGEEGLTCLGKKIPVKEGKDIPLPVGENTKASEDGFSVIATVAGQPLLKDGKIIVSAVYEVKGDVDYKMGNVNFKGSIIVTGNVMSGFKVVATDDVEIRGNIEKAFVEAGGDVRIRGGMYGTGEGKITAGGSITIRSIESGILDAGSNIILNQQARNSMLMAGNDIILSNSKGSIVGGKAMCGHHYDVSNVGSPSFTETIIEIGVNPKIKVVYDEIFKKIEEHKNQFEKVTNNIKSLKSKGAQVNEKEKEILGRLVPAFHQLRTVIEADTAKLAFLKEKIDKLSVGRCKVRGKTYPGVKFYTANASMAVRTEINHSSFYEQNEQIIVGPY